MSRAKFVLEVVKYHINVEDNLPELIHVGYMKGKFKTKKDAVSYYDKHNPHMRSLNGDDNHYCSDWDPETRLLYIVRDDYCITGSIDCFLTDDNTEIKPGFTKFKWLK
jgi:hypothetical protein